MAKNIKKNLDNMFVASSTNFFQIMPLVAKMALPRMSHVFVEVLHPANFVNITHVKP